jgi:CRP-like cAMP-binding protein
MGDAKLDALASVPFFSRLPRKDLVYLASHVDEVRADAGTALTREGRLNHTFYLLLEGEVEVTIDQRPQAILRRGDVLGEISMLNHARATATALTLIPTHLLVMSHRQFHDAILGDPRLRAQVTVTGNTRLGEKAQCARARSTPSGGPSSPHGAVSA